MKYTDMIIKQYKHNLINYHEAYFKLEKLHNEKKISEKEFETTTNKLFGLAESGFTQ